MKNSSQKHTYRSKDITGLHGITFLHEPLSNGAIGHGLKGFEHDKTTLAEIYRR